MKFKNMYLKVFFCSIVAFPIHVYAENVKITDSNKFDLVNKKSNQNDSNWNEKNLDDYWEKRSDKEVQKKIIQLIESQSPVPQNFEIAWKISRLASFCGNFGLGETLPNKERAQIFLYGFNSADIAKQLESNRVEGYYWYAVNLGSYGIAKGVVTVLKNAAKGRDSLLLAIQIDPKYQWAGAYRVLGRYYDELPEVVSFGDKKKAEMYLKKAVELAPEFRLNKIYLGNLYNQEGKKKEAKELFLNAKKLPDVDGAEEEVHYKKLIELNLKELKTGNK